MEPQHPLPGLDDAVDPLAPRLRSEVWVDPRTRPDFDEWVALFRREGEAPAPSESVGYDMTRMLLRDLLTAGGGVEAEFLRLRDALDAAQEETDALVGNSPELLAEPWPEFGVQTSALPLPDAHYAFWNQLTWVRSVADRVDRGYIPSRRERVGLLPAMAAGPRRDRVQRALDTYKQQTRDTREFANFLLHSGSIPGGGTPSAEIAHPQPSARKRPMAAAARSAWAIVPACSG